MKRTYSNSDKIEFMINGEAYKAINKFLIHLKITIKAIWNQ